MNEVYNGKNKGLIDDYIHFKDKHEHELERITRELIQSNGFSDCSIGECEYTKRHMQQQSTTTSASDAQLSFYGEIFDALHFHLFHCFEAGLRVRRSDDNDQMEEEEKATKDQYFDAQFARMNRRILERHHNTASFDRFSTKHTKFNIVNDAKHDTNKDNTYSDQMVKHLIHLRMDQMQIQQFMQFLNEEQYDTDAMDHDYDIKPNGNIASGSASMTTQNQTLLKHYNEFIKDTKLESSSFNIGFRFYYWSSYKDGKEPTQKEYNIWDHSGYDIKELFIAPKYASFKEEISHYKYVSLQQYEAKIRVKVNQYIQSDTFKQTTASHSGTYRCSYEIQKGEPIRFEHLLALVLYTDYSELSSHFSGTFRKKNPFETVTSVKKRNAIYYWMSRRLRECVEIFGQCRAGDRRYNKDKDTRLSGPFFCGMNGVMSMPSFCMRLCSPTSTSKQIEVAMKFSGKNGIVLQMDNPMMNIQYEWLHGFNASWISRYKEEDERLFFGGLWPIQIQSIRIRSTKQNFAMFIRCLHYLDTLVTGGQMYGMKVTEDDVFIIECLMNDL
eukprot:123577_1